MPPLLLQQSNRHQPSSLFRDTLVESDGRSRNLSAGRWQINKVQQLVGFK
jgi:hypothetical protein